MMININIFVCMENTMPTYVSFRHFVYDWQTQNVLRIIAVILEINTNLRIKRDLIYMMNWHIIGQKKKKKMPGVPKI